MSEAAGHDAIHVYAATRDDCRTCKICNLCAPDNYKPNNNEAEKHGWTDGEQPLEGERVETLRNMKVVEADEAKGIRNEYSAPDCLVLQRVT